MLQLLTEITTSQSSLSIGNVLREAEELLFAVGVENPRLDAEAILAHCLGIETWRLLLERERVLSPAEETDFQRLLEARRRRRPLAYILGEVGFHDLVLAVDPRALIPRPETEILVEEAIRFLEGKVAPEVIEIGCGTGAIALALVRQLPGAEIGVSDISPAALVLARKNAARLGLGERIDFRSGDLFAPWADRRGRGVDLVVANPPYLSREELAAAPPEVRDYEPREALDGGEDGRAVIRRLAAEAPRYLRPGGRLLIEIGARQGAAVRELASPPATVIARSPNGVRATKQSQPASRGQYRTRSGDCFAPSALAMTESGGGKLEFIRLVRDYCGRDRVAVFGRRDG
jgi:release factor glutamine methyltransferase